METITKNFKTEILSAAITGQISTDNVYGLYELHRFVFEDETISKSSQIDAQWSNMKNHLLKLYPQLGNSSYNPQLDTSFDAWNRSQAITIGAELPVCPIGQKLTSDEEDMVLEEQHVKKLVKNEFEALGFDGLFDDLPF